MLSKTNEAIAILQSLSNEVEVSRAKLDKASDETVREIFEDINKIIHLVQDESLNSQKRTVIYALRDVAKKVNQLGIDLKY